MSIYNCRPPHKSFWSPATRQTAPGAPIGNSDAHKHGRYTAKAIARRRELAALIRCMRGLAEEVDN